MIKKLQRLTALGGIMDFGDRNNSKCSMQASIIFTEAYRKDEYKRSEYFNQNSQSRIVPIGSFHYIQWEKPKEIAGAVTEIVISK